MFRAPGALARRFSLLCVSATGVTGLLRALRLAELLVQDEEAGR